MALASGEFHLFPGSGIGPLKIGTHLNDAFKILQENFGVETRQMNVYFSKSSLLSLILVEVGVLGLVLRFNPVTQRLILLELSQFGVFTLLYERKRIFGKQLLERNGSLLSLWTMYQTFGPTFEGRVVDLFQKGRSSSDEADLNRRNGTEEKAADRKEKSTGNERERNYLVEYTGLTLSFDLPTEYDQESVKQLMTHLKMDDVTGGHAQPQLQKMFIHSGSASGSSGSTGLFPGLSGKSKLRRSGAKDIDVVEIDADVSDFDVVLESSAVDEAGSDSSCALQKKKSLIVKFPKVSAELNSLRITSTEEDVLLLLGNPDNIYYKTEDKMRIHSPKLVSGSLAEEPPSEGGLKKGSSKALPPSKTGQRKVRRQAKEATMETLSKQCFTKYDYFLNYYDLGVDFLIDCDSKEVIRIILHTNLPAQPNFLVYKNCKFCFKSLNSCSTEVGEASVPEFAFYQPFEDIKQVVPCSSRPMIRNNDRFLNSFLYCTEHAEDRLIFEVAESGFLASLTIY